MNGYDIAYGLGLTLTAPYWLVHRRARGKVLAALRHRVAGDLAPRGGAGPAVLIHAVSLGEINATPALVAALRQDRSDLQIVISATTDTGHARAVELYTGQAPDVTVIRYPLDFTRPVTRVLDAVRPDVVVLLELELWPNFLRACERRGIPVALVNGRMTPTALRNYRLGGGITRRMFRRLAVACVQDPVYADRFVACGVPPDRARVTGTMKFDTARVADRIDGDAQLAASVGLRPGEEPVWVCGSTGPGEEALILAQYRQLLPAFPALRLVIVPRHPPRFDEVAAVIASAGFPVVRRSRARGGVAGDVPSPPTGAPTPAVVLGDTTGELRTFYSVADVVLVGRTLLDRGPRQRGSDMIEPAALGKPVVVGPWTQNFADAMGKLRAGDGIVEVTGADQVATAVRRLLGDRAAARETGARAQAVVRGGQGATRRHADVILGLLDARTHA